MFEAFRFFTFQWTLIGSPSHESLRAFDRDGFINFLTFPFGFRNFLKECNAIDQFGLLLLLKNNHQILEDDLNRSFRIEGIVRNAWQSSAISFLAENKSLRKVQTELPVDGTVTEIISSQIKYEQVDGCHPKDVSCPKQSQSLEYTLTILKSFLNLLVNSRDEVAIACALACPLVNLSHEGFTIIKRAASQEKSPIYQFVLSYVMKKRLGGAGYAAPENCPISTYGKELANFVDVMDKLQTLVEDNPKASVAINKITNCILSRLSKAIAGNAMKISMIDKARDIVKTLFERIQDQNVPTDSSITAGIIGRDTISVLRTLADELATLGYHQGVSKMLCSPFSAATPSKTPVGSQTLFRLFRSPTETKEDEDDFVPLQDRVPIAPTPPPKPVVAFAVKYEPEAPRLHIFEDNGSPIVDVKGVARKGEPFTPSKPAKSLAARGKNQDTPVIKTLAKRKNGHAKDKGPKKRLKLVSALDPENLPAGNSSTGAAALKAKAKPQKKPKETNPNQRSLHSFFTRI